MLPKIQSLYDQGAFLQALRAGAALGPVASWRTTAARILAGRLAGQLSAHRLSDALLLRAWRADPKDPEARYFGARALFSRRGALAALEYLNGSALLETDTPRRWEATALAASLYAEFHDFDRAEHLIGLALDHEDTAWMWIERSAIYERADRYDEALDAAEQAYDRNPLLPAAVFARARLLSLREQDRDAIAIIRQTLKALESPPLVAYLANLEMEQGSYDRALECLDQFERWAVLPDKHRAGWLAGRRCDLYSLLCDRRTALVQARAAKGAFYDAVAARILTAPSEAARVLLPVGFVRQHHMTCAPATLSAISRYWNQPADHLEVAEAICYDGTPHHSERQWAVTHGWAVREFTVTWDATRALVDAGIPFTVTTPFPGGSHLQAVVGYDSVRGTLLIRDPYEPHTGEFAEATFFQVNASTGPRGMALVPLTVEGRLKAIVLPEAELYDRLHEVQQALAAHDRPRAAAHAEALSLCAPSHRLVLEAQRALASYDDDQSALVGIIEALLGRSAQNDNLRLAKISFQRHLADRDTYLQYAEAQATTRGAHALFGLRYAQALLDDGRRLQETLWRLERLARRGCSAELLSTLGDAHWYAGDYPRAVERYRLAATQDQTNEHHSAAYFRAARLVRKEEEAIAFLRTRMRRYGSRSSRPAITLYDCLEEVNRTAEATEVRTQVMAERPEDGEAFLFAVRSALDRGAVQEAKQWLQEAKGRCRPADWLRASARLHEHAGELAMARVQWVGVVETEPLNLTAQREVVRLTADTEGRAQAIDYVRALVDRFPHHQGLSELLAEWLSEAPLDAQEVSVRRVLLLNATNAWASRQLAIILAKQGRIDEARSAVARALAVAPQAIQGYTVQGFVELRAGWLEEARSAFREALRRSVDSDYALRNLLDACATPEERREALLFVVEEMKRQVVVGECLLVFQEVARHTFEPDEVQAILDEARECRPDLWQTWAACSRQMLARQQYEAAGALCRQALSRFPLIPRLHVELAETAKLSGDRLGERAALQEALRLNPAWGYAARQLAESWEAEGTFAASRAVLEQTVRRSPSDAALHGYLGHTLWQLGERAGAMDHLERAVRLDIWYEWAWNTFREQGIALGRPEAALSLARELATQRPGEPAAWLALARMTDSTDERLAAVDRCIALAPLIVDAHLLKLDFLIQVQRFDEALTALQATAWGPVPPMALRMKEPQILAARGELDDAVIALEALLQEDSQNVQGWRLLTEWQDQRNDSVGYLAAARRWHSLEPDHADALGYLADALAKAEETTDVRPYLRRALTLRPDYAFAGQWLFDLELHAGALDKAERVLGILQAHVKTMETRLRAVRLANGRKSLEQVLTLVGEMLQTMREDELDTVREAMAAVDQAGWRRQLNELIHAFALDARSNPLIGRMWVERRAEPWFAWNRYRGVGDVIVNGAVGDHAAYALLEQYGSGMKAKALHRLRDQYGTRWATHDTLFPALASAFMGALDPLAALNWIGEDWQERPELSARVLLTLACALRYMGRPQEAHDVHLAALERKEDRSFPMHRLWLALDGACHGDYTPVNPLHEGAWRSPIEYLYGTGEYQRAIHHFLPAAQGGDATARKCIESLYLYGYGPDPATAQVLPWYTSSAEATRANNEKRYGDAVKWLEQAALEGNVAAIQQLGQMCRIGKGVDSDPLTGFLLCVEAMRYGHLLAKANVAWALIGGLQGRKGVTIGWVLKKEHHRECMKIKTIFLA